MISRKDAKIRPGAIFTLGFLLATPLCAQARAVNAGAAIFAAKCGIGYCHGKEGRAGRGPRLAGRKFDRDYLVRTISGGVGNSLMPAFKDQLSVEEISAVVAYILSLSGGSAPTGSAAPAETGAKPEAPRQVSPGAGDPEAGRAIFFDAANPKHCAVCHRYGDRGAEVGPDLTGQAERPPKEILGDIIEPDARLSVEPVAVLTKAGQRMTGIKSQENKELIRIYETSSLPPVLRTIYKEQIARIEPDRHSPMPGDYGAVLTRKQLLDLVAFLKQAPVAPAEIE